MACTGTFGFSGLKDSTRPAQSLSVHQIQLECMEIVG